MLNLKKKTFKYPFKKYKKLKSKKQLSKFIKKKNLNINTIKLIKNFIKKEDVKISISIKVTPNNIFCTVINFKTKEILLNKSSGNYSINLSKKLLKYYHKIILEKFFLDIDKFKNENEIILNLTAPLKLRKLILKQFIFNFKKSKLYLNFKNLKIFNGCRPKKKKRKKQKGLRIR